MSRYLDISEKVMRILHSYTAIVEQVSVDEAFMDVTGALRKWKTPVAFAEALKKSIRQDMGLTASVGVAGNKFLAKLASDMKKPDGLVVVPEDPEAIMNFLAPLPVGKIWGVGKITEKKLHRAGFRLVSDIQAAPVQSLVPVVGSALAQHIWELARGLDERDVTTDSETKSISAEHTFDHDIADVSIVRQQLIELVGLVGRRLRREEFVAATVFIKVRFEDFQTISRQETFMRPVCSDRSLTEAAVALFERQKIGQPVRLIGMGVSGLTPPGESVPQLELFADPEAVRELRNGRLDRAVDAIKDKLGSHAVRRASSLLPGTGDGRSRRAPRPKRGNT